MIVADDLLAEFVNEATSHLDAADGDVSRLSRDGRSAILGILRRIHTIRGTAGFLGLPQLEQLSVVEIVLDDLRGRATLPPDAERRVRRALSVARAIVATAERPGGPGTPAPGPEHGGGSAGPAGPLLLVSGAAVDRVCGIAEALASPAGDDAGLRRALVGQLAREVAAVRRQPLRYAWSKLGRVVEEIASATGKSVALETSGGEVALDYRSVVLVRDALTHLVRNAAHHGIEDPASRAAHGKPETGTIRLAATTGPDRVIVDITDDGAGLDLDAIRHRAVALGLLSDGDVGLMGEAAIAELVFAPGFSTSDSVGPLSGLGIGLDVVRTNIAELGGTVSLGTIPGGGLRVSIVLPLTQEDAAPCAAPPEPVRADGAILLVARAGPGRDALRSLLAALGHPVEAADDAGAALALALGRPFAAIVADHDLPDRPGLDLARAVRRHPPLAGIALVLLMRPGARLPEADRRSLDLVAVPHPFGRTAPRGSTTDRSAA